MHRVLQSRCVLLPVLALLPGLFARDAGSAPMWWSNVVNHAAVTNDFAAANQGQAKWFAAKAASELDTRLPGGAGTNVAAIVAGFSLSSNYVAVNHGQLKALATPFYDRLITLGFTNGYPWTTTTTDDISYAAVNVGQLKHVFSLQLDFADADADGLSDIWEVNHFGNINSYGASDDPDGDGLDNASESTAGTNPTLADTDGDGVSDGLEVARGTDPNDSGSLNRIIWVAVGSGSASYDGYAPTFTGGVHGPKRTIAAGIETAISGDTISVAGGSYATEPAVYEAGSKRLTLGASESVMVE